MPAALSTADEEGSAVKRFGLLYGTLVEHAASGEERFTVEWNRDDDRVGCDILVCTLPLRGWECGSRRAGSGGYRSASGAGVLVQRLNQTDPGQLGKISRQMANAGVNIELFYSDLDHQPILSSTA